MYNRDKYREPSKYMAPADLGGKRVEAIITGTVEETFEGDTHPTLFITLQGMKQLRVNMGRGDSLVSFFGENEVDWVGKRIVLAPAKIRFKNKLVDTIALELPRQLQL